MQGLFKKPYLETGAQSLVVGCIGDRMQWEGLSQAGDPEISMGSFTGRPAGENKCSLYEETDKDSSVCQPWSSWWPERAVTSQHWPSLPNCRTQISTAWARRGLGLMPGNQAGAWFGTLGYPISCPCLLLSQAHMRKEAGQASRYPARLFQG